MLLDGIRSSSFQRKILGAGEIGCTLGPTAPNARGAGAMQRQLARRLWH